MGKKPSCVFMQFPLSLLWPQGRQFLAVESSARADHGVVNAYIVASDHPQQPAEADHKLGAARFTGHHEPSKVRRLREQASELFIGKVVQEQVTCNDIRAQRSRICQKIED